jgi:hypothetical protein
MTSLDAPAVSNVRTACGRKAGNFRPSAAYSTFRARRERGARARRPKALDI